MLQNFALTKFPDKNIVNENMATSRTRATKSLIKTGKNVIISKKSTHIFEPSQSHDASS